MNNILKFSLTLIVAFSFSITSLFPQYSESDSSLLASSGSCSLLNFFREGFCDLGTGRTCDSNSLVGVAMASKACLMRLQKEYQRLAKEPLPDIVAEDINRSYLRDRLGEHLCHRLCALRPHIVLRHVQRR